MLIARLSHETDFDGWRTNARNFLQRGIPPSDIAWRIEDAGSDLFDLFQTEMPPIKRSDISVARQFVSDAMLAVCHRDSKRFDLLYRLLWRMQDTPSLLGNAVDDDVYRLHMLTKAIRRDRHKMHAFVRFRKIEAEAEETFAAWFEPEHRITELAAPFFMRRFANMRWSILTPDRCAHWDTQNLLFSAGMTQEDAPDSDDLETLWRGYFRSTFNPARLKVKAMTSEMPQKYWKNLPEADLIKPMIASARAQEAQMIAAKPTKIKRVASYDFIDTAISPSDCLNSLKKQASVCRYCDHACHATQTVFGEGPLDAKIMIVGEQPGDMEDISGRPFVGPAGRVLDTAFSKAGLNRDQIYLTNAVKHFHFEPKGKVRLHKRPRTAYIEQCRWWLGAERHLIKPAVTIALGTTAIYALSGKQQGVKDIGQSIFQCLDGGAAIADIHPSSILRQVTKEEKKRSFSSLVATLKAAKLLHS